MMGVPSVSGVFASDVIGFKDSIAFHVWVVSGFLCRVSFVGLRFVGLPLSGFMGRSVMYA